MIKVRFFTEGGLLSGFEISGHSGYASQGEDIVCASVSSAAFMAANTVTDVIGSDADIEVDDNGFFRFVTKPDGEAQVILKGLKIHLEALSGDYPENIKVIK